MIKTYRELRRFHTFEERFEYLKLGGVIGKATFGFERYLNQLLYTSKEWKEARRPIILRDAGCDLGIGNREIFVQLTVHHINPITIDDIENARECLFDPDNLICASDITHKAIHYGDKALLFLSTKERMKGDTTLWPTQTRF